jgi:2-polyprenyl-3-methyl-5-hydroxy-6-metoxy-1,4-benzoquinol methylase
MRREQRLVFGEVAELYDRHRPGYPDPVVDDLIGLAGLEAGTLVLEVGAGTGKATAMFAERGIHVLAVEPSAEMAVVARRRSWHWVEPRVGFAKAARVLSPEGVLAAFWNRPVPIRRSGFSSRIGAMSS